MLSIRRGRPTGRRTPACRRRMRRGKGLLCTVGGVAASHAAPALCCFAKQQCIPATLTLRPSPSPHLRTLSPSCDAPDAASSLGFLVRVGFLHAFPQQCVQPNGGVGVIGWTARGAAAPCACPALIASSQRC